MRLVAIPQTAQHLDGVFDAWFFHIDRSKAAFKRGIFLNVLVIFIAGCRADALQIAARQSWFEHIRGIHGALRRPCSNHGMQLVNKQDHFTVGFLDFLNRILEAFLKFPSKARAGNHGAKVKRDHDLIRQNFGHVIVGNFLRQTFHDSGLSHASSTDQNRVVLGAA